jgi:hypothetical protein
MRRIQGERQHGIPRIPAVRARTNPVAGRSRTVFLRFVYGAMKKAIGLRDFITPLPHETTIRVD